ncbi:MAG TPA: VCBS repeat-containing protein, partial [Micromonosporaceae bacterium]
GRSETGDHFGASLAAGDFRGGGFDDLAIGTPDEADGTVAAAGAIRFLNGSAAGLVATDPTVITQATAGVPGVNETGDRFGASLAAGDVNRDGRDDLISGDPDESVGDVRDAGDIAYLPGGHSGVTGSGTKRFSLATAGVPGTAVRNGSAGFSVTVGDFDGNGYADIAFGAPGSRIGILGTVAGSIVELPGSSSGPRATGATEIDQSTSGVPGPLTETFGWTVRAAHLHGTGSSDLAVGAWLSSSGPVAQAGQAYVLRGVHGAGLTGDGGTAIRQSGPGPSIGASFGWALG